MAKHCGYVVRVGKLRKHTNADRLQVATFFGNDTIVDMSVKTGDLGIYFPEGLALSENYCKANDLVRRKDENGNPAGGFLDPEKRNIKTIRLRGEKSDGLYMPMRSLDYLAADDVKLLKVGDTIDVVAGEEICSKYIPRSNHRNSYAAVNKTHKKKVPISPLFAEHADTEQLAYHMDDFHYGDLVEFTLKMHGTSGRTGYLPKLTGYKRTLLDRLFGREATPQYDWGYVTGTRRTVIDDFSKPAYYDSNDFRKPAAEAFEGKLHKGETVYYEIVGYVNETTPIMGTADNRKMNDKEFVKKYGKTTTFSYGCEPGECDFYAYRMTMTNEDGDVVEYSPDFMRYRCEQMGVKAVPVFTTHLIPNSYSFGDLFNPDDPSTPGELVMKIAEAYCGGVDPVGKTHVREGVVCRIVNRPTFTAYKHKNFEFKVLAGIAMAQAEQSGTIDSTVAEEM